MNDVRDNAGKQRYEFEADGATAFVDYRLTSGVIDFIHTEVPKELGGRGIGSILAKGALEGARAGGLKVIATCPFIAGYIAKHPDYAGLLAK